MAGVLTRGEDTRRGQGMAATPCSFLGSLIQGRSHSRPGGTGPPASTVQGPPALQRPWNSSEGLQHVRPLWIFCSRVQGRKEKPRQNHASDRRSPAANIPHPGSGVFVHQETRTVHLSFFTPCPQMQKCQKCARALLNEGLCVSPPQSISCVR